MASIMLDGLLPNEFGKRPVTVFERTSPTELNNILQNIESNYRLSLFQKILLVTDGTVTDLIKIFTGETIHVQKLAQEIVVDDAPAALCSASRAPLLRRTVLLNGVHKSYLFADSFFVFEKLSRRIQYQLLETDIPIGLMWKKEKTEMFRDIIDYRVEVSADVAKYFAVEAETPLLSRTYTLHRQQEPFGLITEKFPLTHFRQQQV